MVELKLDGRSYQDVVKEVGEVTAELLRNGADVTATLGAIEYFESEVVSQMDMEQIAQFSGRVAWEGATAIISDSDTNPTHAYELLASQTIDVFHATNLVEYGKELDKYNPRSERAHRILRMASDAFVEVWDNMQEQSLEQRIDFFVEEYLRVASLQQWAGDTEGEAITADRIVDEGESLLAEARSSGDERLTLQMNDSLRELAGSLSGGINNPRAQRLLRETSAEDYTLDFLELRILEDTADTLLKCGMIDKAFDVYRLTSNFDPNEVRRMMQEMGKKSAKQIKEHIQLKTGSLPGSPWGAILEMQQQSDTKAYVSQVLDRIKVEYPTTYQSFSYGHYLKDPAVYEVLINVNRSEELTEIVRGNAKGEDSSNLRFMAGRMAAMMMTAGKQELYDQVVAATKDVPGAEGALLEGYKAVMQQE